MKPLALILGFLIFTPVILWIVVSEWCKYLGRGPEPSPFIAGTGRIRAHQHIWVEAPEPEDHPFAGQPHHYCIEGLCGMAALGSIAACRVPQHRHDEAQEWAVTMERGRQIQAKEEA